MYPKLVKVISGTKRVRSLVYLRLIERIKVNGIWKERVVANLGRQDVMGRQVLGILLKKLRRFTDEVLVTPQEIETRQVKDYGSILVGYKLWEEIGLGEWIRKVCGEPKGISLGEPGVLAMVVNRLTEPKSKLGLYDWMPTVYLPQWQSKKFELPDEPGVFADRFYQTMDYLIKGKNKEKIEGHIINWARTLFPVEVIFYDITNIQFEGWEKLKQARYGYIRLGKKNHKQILLGLVLMEGIPVASHIFRGNRAEKTTLLWIRDKIRKQFSVGRIIFVCDRGMISEDSLNEIEVKEDGYIVALKRRKCNEVKPLLEIDTNSFTPICISDDGEVLLSARESCKENGKRLIAVFNPIKANVEKKKRLEIIEELRSELNAIKERALKSKNKKEQKDLIVQVEKILSHKHGKRYFRYSISKDGNFEFSLNEESIYQEEKLDGKFIIKTTEETPSIKEIVFKYKELMEVEDSFRQLKDFIRVAPVFHWEYRRVKAHIFICVLALLLERYLEQKLKKAKIQYSARKVIEKLKTIKIVENQVGHLILKYVTPPNQELEKILSACGIFKLPKILSDYKYGGIEKEVLGSEK